MSEEKKEFTIKDRRVFSEERADVDEKEKAQEPASTEKDQEEGAEAAPEMEPPLPEINFSTFLLSLNASALVNLGLIDNPATGKKEKMLTLAKQTIDIMGMLQEKTSGNLTTDEESLLKNILYELRLNYVKQKK